MSTTSSAPKPLTSPAPPTPPALRHAWGALAVGVVSAAAAIAALVLALSVPDPNQQRSVGELRATAGVSTRAIGSPRTLAATAPVVRLLGGAGLRATGQLTQGTLAQGTLAATPAVYVASWKGEANALGFTVDASAQLSRAAWLGAYADDNVALRAGERQPRGEGLAAAVVSVAYRRGRCDAAPAQQALTDLRVTLALGADGRTLGLARGSAVQRWTGDGAPGMPPEVPLAWTRQTAASGQAAPYVSLTVPGRATLVFGIEDTGGGGGPRTSTMTTSDAALGGTWEQLASGLEATIDGSAAMSHPHAGGGGRAVLTASRTGTADVHVWTLNPTVIRWDHVAQPVPVNSAFSAGCWAVTDMLCVVGFKSAGAQGSAGPLTLWTREAPATAWVEKPLSTVPRTPEPLDVSPAPGGLLLVSTRTTCYLVEPYGGVVRAAEPLALAPGAGTYLGVRGRWSGAGVAVVALLRNDGRVLLNSVRFGPVGVGVATLATRNFTQGTALGCAAVLRDPVVFDADGRPLLLDLTNGHAHALDPLTLDSTASEWTVYAQGPRFDQT